MSKFDFTSQTRRLIINLNKELGFTPTGGMGMGIDRMVMLLCGTNIRDIIAFPFVKPNN